MSNQEYKAEFTKDQIILAILKLTANNNVMLQITLEHLIEVRKSLTAIECYLENPELNEKMKPIMEALTIDVRNTVKETIERSEDSVIKMAYEWAFLNDPDSFDFNQFGLNND